jgi:hypothetical protein
MPTPCRPHTCAHVAAAGGGARREPADLGAICSFPPARRSPVCTRCYTLRSAGQAPTCTGSSSIDASTGSPALVVPSQLAHGLHAHAMPFPGSISPQVNYRAGLRLSAGWANLLLVIRLAGKGSGCGVLRTRMGRHGELGTRWLRWSWRRAWRGVRTVGGRGGRVGLVKGDDGVAGTAGCAGVVSATGRR